MRNHAQSVRLNDVENPARSRWSSGRATFAITAPAQMFLIRNGLRCRPSSGDATPSSRRPPKNATRASRLHELCALASKFIASLPARGLLGLIWLYRHSLSPVLPVVCGPGCGCRFHPTCSVYAAEAVSTHGAVRGSFMAVRRLLKCHPWHPGGFDPVPPRRRPICQMVSQGSGIS
jgi:hypothetical protein